MLDMAFDLGANEITENFDIFIKDEGDFRRVLFYSTAALGFAKSFFGSSVLLHNTDVAEVAIKNSEATTLGKLAELCGLTVERF
jgi:hypothetical protein